jgi:hypothetical protein
MDDLEFSISKPVQFPRKSEIDPALKKTVEAVKNKKNIYEKTIGAKVVVNESVGKAAFYYEKLRNAIDYQDEHLFLKNAIKRILKRRTYFGAKGNGLALLKELVWAKYFENDTLPITLAEEIESILRKYAYFKDNVHPSNTKIQSTDLFLSFAACEIEELLSPCQEKEEYFSFVQNILEQKIKLEEIDEKSRKIQTEIAIRKIILKEDAEQLRYRILSSFYDDWPKVKKTEGQNFVSNFSQYFYEAEEQLKQSKSSKIAKYIKKNSPAFKIILESIYKGAQNFEYNISSEDGFNSLIRAEVARKNENIKSRMVRAIIRGIIFILLTKIVMAVVIEIPYELSIMKEINWPALLTNIILPPSLMIIIGVLIKVPGQKNTSELVKLANSVVFEGLLPVKDLKTVKKPKSKKFLVFNTIYSFMAIAVLAGVIWLLIFLKFNFVSIGLFYIFVSLVSFLGFRIRAIAQEYEVKPEQDSVLSGLYNFILFPFVVIGKFLSDRWSEYNFTLLFWDFVIEAPFKAVIGLFEAWLAFSREKREEFE